MLDRLVIREITPLDAPAAARLSEELGYPVSPDVMLERIAFLSRLPDRVVCVACLSAEVVGWVDIGLTHHLQSEPRVEIGGLVVSSEARSRGIGHALVAHAEQWARQKGLMSMLVRSQVKREAAHRFYLREGYVQTKTSVVFTKELG